MRIGLVIKEFDPHRGGAEHWTWQFARWLADAGHEVHVIASRFSATSARFAVVPHHVPQLSSPIAWAAAAESVLQPLRLDLIHDMGQGWLCDFFQPHGGSRTASFEHNLLLLPAWLRPVKRALSSVAPRYRAFQRLAARQYQQDGRCVIALSQMVAGHMRRYHGVPPERLRVVYNGVDLERFSPDHRRLYRGTVRQRLGVRDELLLFIAAHHFRLKGVHTLLRAMARLTGEGRRVHLAIAGGKHLRPFQRLAARLGIAAAVSFLGSQSDVVPYYAAADVYVQPTFYDPCSLVVLEALASGLPVITSRFNGAGELIQDGIQGYVIDDPADEAALAERIALLSDIDRVPMERAARTLAEAHSFERNCQEIMSVYQESSPKRRLAA